MLLLLSVFNVYYLLLLLLLLLLCIIVIISYYCFYYCNKFCTYKWDVRCFVLLTMNLGFVLLSPVFCQNAREALMFLRLFYPSFWFLIPEMQHLTYLLQHLPVRVSLESWTANQELAGLSINILLNCQSRDCCTVNQEIDVLSIKWLLDWQSRGLGWKPCGADCFTGIP